MAATRASSWAGLGPDAVLACLGTQLQMITDTARRVLDVPDGLMLLADWYCEVRQGQQALAQRFGIDAPTVQALGAVRRPTDHVSRAELFAYVIATAESQRSPLPWWSGDAQLDLAFVARADTAWVPTIAELGRARLELLA